MTASKWIRLEEAQCHNCMRCVRACPTKAMTYVHSQPIIVDEECILCGQCYSVCPHDAKAVRSELKQVQQWLDEGQEIILSLAPSYASVWPDFDALKEELLARGFAGVEETARGAAVVSRSYENLIEKGEMENIISTACPAANALIEKEYGELTKFMAPVAPPLIVHGRMIKKEHPDAKVVFVSPCIAKYKEIEDPRFAGVVDACIGMEELIQLVPAGSHTPPEKTPPVFDGSIARLYPTPGGIVNTLPQKKQYNYVNIDGVKNIRKVLDALKEGSLSGYFIEVSTCDGSCMNGPLLQHFRHNEWLGQARVRSNVDMTQKVTAGEVPVPVQAAWQEQDIWRQTFSEEEIQAEMIALGKTSPSKIHDCGACGYESCRDKAIAVLEGKADPRICLPDALEQAQSLSNVIIANSPNGILVLDKDYNVQEMNPSARKMLNLEMVNPTGMYVGEVLPDDALERLIKMTDQNTETMRVRYESLGKVIDHAIVKIKDRGNTVVILMDRTAEDANERQVASMRQQTLQVTDQVIEEQMRTVQEIASLLGETTAHSKVALTQLKEAMEDSHE
jgi:iron only hydrogenase large subunit-like protein/uncharacterized Fe-S cluster-containing protein